MRNRWKQYDQKFLQRVKAVGILKGTLSFAWVALWASLLMLFSVSDDYPGGYETMVGHACILFVVGAAAALAGVVAGAIWQRGKISGLWMAVGGLQVFASLIVILILLLISSSSR